MHFLHVAVHVTDLGRSAAFYEGVLGWQAVERPLRFPGLWYQLGAVQIHLIVREAPLPAGGELPPAVLHHHRPSGRNPHIALAVSNLENWQRKLTAAGVVWEPSASGRAAIFLADPDGNVLELQGTQG